MESEVSPDLETETGQDAEEERCQVAVACVGPRVE
jgi:hypothetical protein